MKLVNSIVVVLICTVLLAVNTVAARDWFVSHTGAGAKDGTSVDNAWAGWRSIDWDTDGEGPDEGVGGGDTLYVIGTVRATTYPILGCGLSESQRFTIASYPGNPGRLWQGLEIDDSGWTGPDAYGAYSKAVKMGTVYGYAAEWTSNPWNDAVTLKPMPSTPDKAWNTSRGLYFCNSAGVVYYKPSNGTPTGKKLTAWASTSKVFLFDNKPYLTVSGLVLNNPIWIYNNSDYNIIENNEIFCSGTQTAIQIGAYPGGYLGAHHGIIRGNSIHNCGNGIYFVNQVLPDAYNNNFWTVENNVIYNIRGTKDSHCIGVQGGTGSIFQGNTLYDAGSGITFWNQSAKQSGNDQTLKNNTVRFNYIYHMGYDGVGYGRGIEFSGETGDSDYTTGNLIYGNIIRDCITVPDVGYGTGTGIRIKNGIPSSGYSIKAFNNTVSDCYYSFYIMPTNYENYEVGAYLHNNISYNPKANGYHVEIAGSPATSTFDLSFDNNIYFGTGSFKYKGKLYGNLINWKSGTNLDSNSINTDPKLNTNLIPQTAGSGIDRGENLSSLASFCLHPSTVFPTGVNNANIVTAEQSAYGSGWDIGAYIYDKDFSYLKPPMGLRVLK